jgi:hypothetical protein
MESLRLSLSCAIIKLTRALEIKVSYILGDIVTKRTPEQRFWDYVTMTDSCWDWGGAISSNGYGNFRNGVKQVLVHRFIYERLFGKTELQIDHLCRNRHCVNPDHLEAVTQRENIKRGVGVAAKNMAKSECSRGHTFNADNTYVNPSGSRVCRTCNALRSKYYRTGDKHGL